MRKFLVLLIGIACVTTLTFSQSSFVPPAVAATVSSNGSPSGPWNFLIGNPGSYSSAYVPPASGLYYCSDGTGKCNLPSQWFPCTLSACFSPNSSTVASAEVVASSATPTFSTAFNVSRNVLTANVTSFTLGPASDGQQKTLCFKQGSGSYTVSAPANVHGFFTVGITASEWNCQSFVYDNSDSIWLATSTGVINQ